MPGCCSLWVDHRPPVGSTLSFGMTSHSRHHSMTGGLARLRNMLRSLHFPTNYKITFVGAENENHNEVYDLLCICF